MASMLAIIQVGLMKVGRGTRPAENAYGLIPDADTGKVLTAKLTELHAGEELTFIVKPLPVIGSVDELLEVHQAQLLQNAMSKAQAAGITLEELAALRSFSKAQTAPAAKAPEVAPATANAPAVIQASPAANQQAEPDPDELTPEELVGTTGEPTQTVEPIFP
jgi:hypothetical protein